MCTGETFDNSPKERTYQLIYKMRIFFSGKSTKTGKLYAFKQERPANLWEFYISLEIPTRVEDAKIVSVKSRNAVLKQIKSTFSFGISASRLYVCGKSYNWSQFQYFRD